MMVNLVQFLPFLGFLSFLRLLGWFFRFFKSSNFLSTFLLFPKERTSAKRVFCAQKSDPILTPFLTLQKHVHFWHFQNTLMSGPFLGVQFFSAFLVFFKKRPMPSSLVCAKCAQTCATCFLAKTPKCHFQFCQKVVFLRFWEFSFWDKRVHVFFCQKPLKSWLCFFRWQKWTYSFSGVFDDICWTLKKQVIRAGFLWHVCFFGFECFF